MRVKWVFHRTQSFEDTYLDLPLSLTNRIVCLSMTESIGVHDCGVTIIQSTCEDVALRFNILNNTCECDNHEFSPSTLFCRAVRFMPSTRAPNLGRLIVFLDAITGISFFDDVRSFYIVIYSVPHLPFRFVSRSRNEIG